jgi:hypothetical protein
MKLCILQSCQHAACHIVMHAALAGIAAAADADYCYVCRYDAWVEDPGRYALSGVNSRWVMLQAGAANAVRCAMLHTSDAPEQLLLSASLLMQL